MATGARDAVDRAEAGVGGSLLGDPAGVGSAGARGGATVDDHLRGGDGFVRPAGHSTRRPRPHRLLLEQWVEIDERDVNLLLLYIRTRMCALCFWS